MAEQEFEGMMQKLRDEYVRIVPIHTDEMERIWRSLNAAAWDMGQFQDMVRLAHNLAGSGATYGIARISTNARALELYAKSLDATHLPCPSERAKIETLLAQLRASLC